MATTSPSQPPSEDVERIAGVQLERDLIEAGLAAPVARAIRHALELVVLRLLLALPTRNDMHHAIDDSSEVLRREIDSLRRETRWQFYILFTLMLMLFATVLGSLFV